MTPDLLQDLARLLIVVPVVLLLLAVSILPLWLYDRDAEDSGVAIRDAVERDRDNNGGAR
jgi:flagellar basal body-associated protein FliL